MLTSYLAMQNAILAQNIATSRMIQNADNILVIDDKHIIESGRHEELINLNGKYYDLWSRRQKASGWKI